METSDSFTKGLSFCNFFFLSRSSHEALRFWGQCQVQGPLSETLPVIAFSHKILSEYPSRSPYDYPSFVRLSLRLDPVSEWFSKSTQELLYTLSPSGILTGFYSTSQVQKLQ